VNEEDQLLLRLRKDPQALAELLRQNYMFLYKYMLKVTMNRTLAEDLVQDTMVRAIEKIAAYQGTAKFSTWLIAIATRLYADSLRKRKRERHWQEQERAQALRSLRYEAGSRQADWPEALDALAGLDPGNRVPILLKYYYGYSQDEIADWLDIPAGTVKSRLHNGLKQLRKELKDNDEQSKSSI
jgi:RNA polymerase sigma-70 factor (ECF subfamily)